MTKEGLFRFIATHKLAVLGTVSPSGGPQAAVVGIAVTPELELVFDTVKTSRKYANLAADPTIAFVIGGDEEITVQYEGTAEELRQERDSRYFDIYFKTWPECREHLAWPDIVHFLVRPRWIRYSDFNKSSFEISEMKF
jgi:pyridoxine/pyridoxamine 5'-phosphate oxidase